MKRILKIGHIGGVLRHKKELKLLDGHSEKIVFKSKTRSVVERPKVKTFRQSTKDFLTI